MTFFRTVGSHPADRRTTPHAATVDRRRIGVTTPAVGRIQRNSPSPSGSSIEEANRGKVLVRHRESGAGVVPERYYVGSCLNDCGVVMTALP